MTEKRQKDQPKRSQNYTPRHTPRHAAVDTEYTRYSRQAKPQEGKTNKKRKRIILIIVGILIALLAVAGILVGLYASQTSAELKLPQKDLEALDRVLEESPVLDEPFYALIIGSDSRDASNAEAGLSDTMMLARIDPTVPQLTIVSVPRDIEIQLEGYGTQKINASFTFGGPAGAVDAVSELCGVTISHYVEIDFPGVISLVDTLGGIDVYVPEDIELDGVYIPAGEQHLNGEQALIMSRCRNYPTGDLVRVVNQQTILKAVVMKVLSSDLTSMPGLISELATSVKTTMEVGDAVDLALTFRGKDTFQMYTTTVPTYFNSHDGVSYLGVTEPDFSDMMERVDKGLAPTPTEEELAAAQAAAEAAAAAEGTGETL